MIHPLKKLSYPLCIILGMWLVNACGPTAPERPVDGEIQVFKWDTNEVEVWERFTAAIDSTPVQFIDASLTGNTLKIKVNYKDNATDHEFALLTTDLFVSHLPYPIAHAYFSPSVKRDSSHQIVHDILLFDLTPLKQRYHEIRSTPFGLYINLYVPGEDGFHFAKRVVYK